MSDYGYAQTLHAFDRSMRKLGLDYLDLYLLHWPVPKDFDRTVESYKALEKLLAEKRVRAIGVSNFSARDLDNLRARTSVTPAVNQFVAVSGAFVVHFFRMADNKIRVKFTAAKIGQCTVMRAIQRFADNASRSIAQAIRMAMAG